MEMEEKLHWLEVRINSSLRARNEDVKNMMQNDENRLAFHEFINNEDVRRLFVYIRSHREIIASLSPPATLTSKSVFFLKNNQGVKLTKENIDDEVMYLDCGDTPVEQLDLVIRDVYLPLMCTESHGGQGVSADKLLDMLHRLMATLEVGQGHVEGEILLPLPSIEVLAEAATAVHRRMVVLHVLETTVISWIKQIKGLLKHDPVADLLRQYGPYPGPLDEVRLWATRLMKLNSINKQLFSPVATDILRNLDEANSTYASSFTLVWKEINKAVQETEETLMFLHTMDTWFQQLHDCLCPQRMLRLFAPLIHNLLLVWSHSKYYHQPDKFHNLLSLISNEVVHRAEAMVGEDVLREPLESFSKLKDALRVCAAFRGTYLDYRDKSEEINERNQIEHAEKMIQRPQGPHVLFSTKLYGAHAFQPKYGAKAGTAEEAEEALREEQLWHNSPWPPRNAPAFDLLNAFMERCNDVLELVQTTRHFRLLSDAAEVGGAGSGSLDALVKEIHQKYTTAMSDFFSQVTNLLSIDGTQSFENAFFTFRTVVKDLERKLADVLRQGFQQCPTIGSQLRLLEVFEGISGRELVQMHLRDKDQKLVQAFTDELIKVRSMFHSAQKRPPFHKNMPPLISRLLWIHALKERVQGPMTKMKKVNAQLLEGDLGWQLRDAYAEATADFDRYEAKIISDWMSHVTSELTEGLKQPLLIADEYEEDEDERPQVVRVNLDPHLLLLLKEIHYVKQMPFSMGLPSQARELIRNTDSGELRVTASRLETIVSKYNTVMKSITEFELPLFERKLTKIDHLFDQGLNQYTWRTEEKADFIETATALVCIDLHRNLDIVQTNCHQVAEITLSWSKGTLDVFTARNATTSYSINELIAIQRTLNDDFENVVSPSGNKIHAILASSFEAIQMSSASPAWQDYVDYMDAIVLDGLKQASLTSLKSMLNQIVKANVADDETIPILRIRLELMENAVAFQPPLDDSTSNKSVQETISDWLDSFLARGDLVDMLGGKGSYTDYIGVDEEIGQLVEHIQRLVKDNAEECTNLYDLFHDYGFLWQLDVKQTFDEFLQGKVSPNPMRNSSKVSTLAPSNLRMLASAKSNNSRASSAKSSLESAGIVGTAEKSFLTPKATHQLETNVPTLDEFDAEIDIFKTARDEIEGLPDYQDVGWLRVDMTPIKQVLTTYGSRWMWTFTKYLSDQVTDMLEKLDTFLKRIEPEIEGITGEERDTASFMKMMRLFNEVSAQQSEMDGKFAAMHRTVLLVKKYGQQLPDHTQQLFDAAPARWNTLKTKVSLAKQRLGPRIQEESDRITMDLATFGERVNQLHSELENSEVYSRECSLGESWVIIDNFVKRLQVLENEAQDLIELQDLLETSVVNFSLLPHCRLDLNNLKSVWETVRLIDEQQGEWKRHRWQKMNTKFLREEANHQLEVVRGLPNAVFPWDVYLGLLEAITTIQVTPAIFYSRRTNCPKEGKLPRWNMDHPSTVPRDCLPLIDDLSNPAMRTRHWKQLVRVTGGAVQVDNDTLKRMTLGELLNLGLQKHVDDVRAIVQRAGKDLSIEQSLKTYEEVWLSKVFETREHVHFQTAQPAHATVQEQDNQSEMSDNLPATTSGSRTYARATSRISNQSSLGRTRRASVCSLPASLLNLGEDSGVLMLLTTTDPIFDELETHQVALQAMQSSSAAGSFLDEVMKWQKRLQTVEAVLTTWLEVQEKWVELEEVFCSQDIRIALPHDVNLFSAVNRDFRLLMRATEKNPNVLQCCQRKNILMILEKMNFDLEHCRRSLLVHLERRRQIFPRFFFLSMEDVLHIICNGYDVGQVNLYIGKLLENVSRLQYEDIEDAELGHFVITGVTSTLGERLPFKQVVACDGQIESWLVALLNGIKVSLQYQVATATGLEKPRTREIHSAGARRVPMPDRRMSKVQKEKSGSRSGSRSSSRNTSRNSPLRAASAKVDKEALAPKESLRPRSWILDHVTEVVHLVTQIQLTQQVSEALAAVDDGNQNALQVCMSKVNSSLRAATLMLRGLEGDKEVQERKERERCESAKHSATEQRPSTTGSTSQSQVLMSPSKQGSTMDMEKHPILEEGDDITVQNNQDPESSSLSVPLANTMTLLAVPTVSQEENMEEANNGKGVADLRLLLFPSQIHKISTLIALLAHQRELLQRLQNLQDVNNGDTPAILLSSCFDWCSQLHYTLDKETRNIQIKCLDHMFDYGFEYIGSSPREVITPLTERVFLTLTQAIQAHNGGLCMGPAGTSRLGTIQELGRALGKPLYTFNCTKSLDSIALHDVFKGFAATGSWICLNNMNNMLPEVLSVCAQLVTAVYDAMRSGKASVHFLSEEVQLTLGGACFGVIDSGIKVRTNDPEKLLLYNSTVSCLSDDILSQFRTVSMLAPDLRLATEVMLISQGFQCATELSKKIILLFEMCSSLSGTNAPITNQTDHLTYNSLNMSGGWSSQVLKYIASESGAILDRMVTAKMKNEEVLKGLASVQEETVAYSGGETATMMTEHAEQSFGAEKMAEPADLQDEEEAVVTALRNTFMPRLLDRDASIFTTLIHDLWPQVDVPMVFGGRPSPDIDMPHSKSGTESRLSKSSSKPVDPLDARSYRGSLNLNTPVVPITSAMEERFLEQVAEGEKQVLTDINDAIAVATGSLGLIPGTTFQARVSQLAELNNAHKTVVVAGPPACGKSETIKTYALAERERGKQMVIQSIFTKSVESDELLGYWDPHTKEWHDGLVPSILRKFCVQQAAQTGTAEERPVLKVLLLDGEVDNSQFELMETILHNHGAVVLGNNERILMPDNLRFFWEVETLAHLTPAILANCGVLVMTSRDVGWRMQLAMWVERRRELDREILRRLCDDYVETVVEHVGAATRAEMTGPVPATLVRYTRVIWQSNEACIHTFTSLLEALINPYTDLSEQEVERYFNFALIWSFGGTLRIGDRESFSVWWRNTFGEQINFPPAYTVYNYLIDNESHQFVPWSEILPSYSGTPHSGIPSDAFVHATSSAQLLHLLGILTDVGKPVMLVGEGGCGKSSIVNERIRTVCSGEVAEVLGLTINTNRFTNARLVYQRLDEHLEWRHGRTYVPKGNKRLLCLIDDINLAQIDKFYHQTATELVRQHIDDGGFYDPDSQMWRYVKNVTYVTTINVKTTANIPPINPRLLRHFAIFGCPYPSSSELHTIFGTLLYTHFITPDLTSAAASGGAGMAHHLGIMDETVRHVVKEEEEALKTLLSLTVTVTLELQDRLRTMFLPTAERCHYMFVMRDLGNIFRNLCLSLRPGCKQESLLLLWEHECEWVYGRRLINEIDSDRYHQTFMTAIRKEFTNEDHITLLAQREKPVFSNLVEQDSGLVTAGQVLQSSNSNMSEEETKTDLYRPQYNINVLRRLVDHGVEEYNKTQPRIKLALYRLVLEQVCRLARVIASPHQVSHCALIAEGCPGRSTIVANLAANLCGFTIFKINPSPVSCPTEYHMDTFKADLVSAYTRTGVKGERLLFLVEEEELLDEDFLVYLTEFIVSGAISHLFTHEEMTTIINSIRTEVTQAGLTYTRDVAWEFFLSTVRKNFRVCLITAGNGTKFQRRCRQYPAFVHNVNFICFPHWTRRQLIKHAAFHLKSVKWMDKVKRENTAHLVATMHLVLRQQDGQEVGSGQYKHITNTSYEKFVERFILMSNARHTEIGETHSGMENMNKQVQLENQLSTRLRKQLEHEKVVLQERRAGTIRILSQIGQDTAITEQQIKIVKAQMEKISRLKKLLPEYQVAHERAVYKAIAIVADTKKVVQNMSIEGLSELRAMQKPTMDIEDLLAAVIMILKTPQADLAWQKGAKRQMANLERFIEELMSFDENVLPESTLSLVEPYLKKSSFDPENIEKKTNNMACSALCRWVRGVCRYNRMMISKVKPLHLKVEETTQAIDGAEHKMGVLDNKRKALEVRLSDLANSFEEATIDKNNQEEKTIKMDKTLETAARLRRVLRQEQNRIQQVLNSMPHRTIAITGGVAMAAAFASYLGPYHYNFRRLMLTVHWPNCLRERGVPLVIDSIDSIRGRVVDWAVDALKTASGASGTEINEEFLEDEDEGEENGEEPEQMEMEPDSEADAAVLGAETETTDKAYTQDDTEGKEDTLKPSITEPEEEEEEEEEHDDEEEEHSDGNRQQEHGSDDTTVTMPVITSEQFNQYLVSLIKLLVGEKMLLEWTKKDFGPRQLENAAILYSSWQRPAMLIDPYGEGQSYLNTLSHKMNRRRLVQLNMDTRSDPQVILAIEKCIMKGKPVILANCTEQLDTMVTPIIHHRNTAHENDTNEEARMIKYCGRRILCHPDFRLYMTTPNPKPCFSSVIASNTTLINYTTSNETLVDDLLMRAFAQIRPELYTDRRLSLRSIYTYKQVLIEVLEYSRQRIQSSAKGPKREMFGENDVDMITDLTLKKRQVTEQLHAVQGIQEQLDTLRDELFPIARRGTMLYAILCSLAMLRREYQFSLPFFMKLFDKAIGGAFPPEFMEDVDYEVEYDDSSSDSHHGRLGGAMTPMSQYSMADSHSNSSSGGSAQDESQEAGSTTLPPTEGEGNEATPPSSPKTNMQPQGSAMLQSATNNDVASIISVPEVPELPSPGVEYTNLPENKIKQIVDNLTSLVYHRVKESLFEEHRLLFATLLCLNVQEESGEHFSEEEISLLIQGVPGVDLHLTLADFECEEEPPSWLPSNKWDDIMALSVMPGPLDGLCVNMASNSDAWKAWYRSSAPDKEVLPFVHDDSKETQGTETKTSQDGGSVISDFHKLLLLRMLRPDRLPIAMTTYINKYLTIDTSKEWALQLDHVAESLSSGGHHGVLVLLPVKSVDGDRFTFSSMKMIHSPIDDIQKLAETRGVSVEVVVIGEGCETTAHEAIDTAERENSWVIINKLNLGSEKFFRDLRFQLQRLSKAHAAAIDGDDDNTAQFCVWMTTTPNDAIPIELLHMLYTLSWDAVERLQNGPEDSKDESEKLLVTGESTFMSLLATTIVISLKTMPTESWDKFRQHSLHIKQAVYAVGVIQGLLMARQMLGTRGMSQFYPLTQSQLVHITDVISSPHFTEISANTLVHKTCKAICEAVYSQLVCTVWDKHYIEALVKHILPAIIDNQEETAKIGSMNIPTPPANIEPETYGTWFEEKMKGEVPTLKGLNLYSNVERTLNNAMATEFLSCLENLYEAQNMDLGDIHASQQKPTNLLRLRAILDTVLEQLPPLLDLGHVPEDAIRHDYDFPYHRPSVISVISEESVLMPETIGFVLLQECMWLNSLLCHIRQNVHDVHQSLLAGPEAFHYDLCQIIKSLDAEHVPAAWLHPNTQPSTHNLASWQIHLKKRYAQMHVWLKQGMVPIFRDGNATPVSHGSLMSIWLGGLVNPGALFTALRQEKAVLSNTLVDDVVLAADVSHTFDEDSYPMKDEGAIYIRGLSLEGAMWDTKKDGLREANMNSDVNSIPSVYVRPILLAELEDKLDLEREATKKEEGEAGPERSYYECPVFMNRARQVCAFTLPLATEGLTDRWVRAGTALILDSGVPEDGPKKSRNFSAPKPVQLTHRTNESPTVTDSQQNSFTEKSPEEGESDGTRSKQSQLSYRAMTPKATPLPPELTMIRESHVSRTSYHPSHADSQAEKASMADRASIAGRTSIAEGTSIAEHPVESTSRTGNSSRAEKTPRSQPSSRADKASSNKSVSRRGSQDSVRSQRSNKSTSNTSQKLTQSTAKPASPSHSTSKPASPSQSTPKSASPSQSKKSSHGGSRKASPTGSTKSHVTVDQPQTVELDPGQLQQSQSEQEGPGAEATMPTDTVTVPTDAGNQTLVSQKDAAHSPAPAVSLEPEEASPETAEASPTVLP